jgi:ATP-binding cassette subfamily C protein CydC
MADIESLEGLTARALVPLAAAPLVALLGVLVLAAVDLPLGLLLALWLLLAGLALPPALARLGRDPGAAQLAARGELNGALVDALQGLPELQAYGQAAAHRERLLAAGREQDAAEARLGRLRALGAAALALCTGLAGLSLLALAASRGVDAVYLALVPLTAFATFEAVQPLAPAMVALSESLAAGRRVFAVADRPEPVPDPAHPLPCPPPGGLDLEVRDLSFRYGAGEPSVLSGLSLRLPAGGRLALAGPSGTGKSTLVRLLARLWDCPPGSIFLAGADLRDYAAEDVRARLAVVPQRPELFNTSLRENLHLARPEASEEELLAACRAAALGELLERLPAGLDTVVGEDGVRFSGGERQRLAIARALLKDAPLLVLDEPTAHLDTATAEQVRRHLVEHAAGRSLLLITHEPLEPWGVDTVLRLGSGEGIDPRGKTR